MDRSEELLQLVLESTNLSDETDKLHNRDSLSGYDNSELNCLDAIGRLDQPNVTALAGEMSATAAGRSASFCSSALCPRRNCREPYASSTTTIPISVPGWEKNNALKIAEERWNDPSLFRFFQGLNMP